MSSHQMKDSRRSGRCSDHDHIQEEPVGNIHDGVRCGIGRLTHFVDGMLTFADEVLGATMQVGKYG